MGCLALALLTPAPLRIQVSAAHSDPSRDVVNRLTLVVHNASETPLTPHFSTDDAGQASAFWTVTSGPSTIRPHTSARIVLSVPAGGRGPANNTPFLVQAVSDAPADDQHKSAVRAVGPNRIKLVRPARRGSPTDGGSRIAALDGLRACAALSVLAYHVLSWSGLTQGGGDHALASGLKGGVALFFVISGFVLLAPSVRALRDGADPPSPVVFLRRRAARILPAYWLALTIWLLVAAGAGAGLPGAGRGADLWRYYLLAQTYDPGTVAGGLGVAWTLCIEVAFYILVVALTLALSMVIARRRRSADARRWAGPMLGAVTGMVAVAWIIRFGFTGSLIARVPGAAIVAASGLPASLDWFALGIGLAVLVAWMETLPRGGPQLTPRLRRLTAIIGTGLLGASFTVQGGDLYLPLDSFAAHVLLGLGSALLVLTAVVPGDGRRPALLASRPMRWLGEISFGVYLYHLPALLLARRALLGLPSDPTRLVALPGPQVVLLTVATLARRDRPRGGELVRGRAARPAVRGPGADRAGRFRSPSAAGLTDARAMPAGGPASKNHRTPRSPLNLSAITADAVLSPWD